MRKLKERDERKQTLYSRIYPMVRIATKASPTSMLLKHSQGVSLPGNQVSSVNTITVTLIPLSTKEFAHKGEGVSTSLVQGCRCRSTPSRRVDDVPASHQMLQGAGAPKYLLVHSRTSHKAQHLALTLSKELILALTLTKFVLSLKI